MILSSEMTLWAVSRILKDDMLPRLETASWEASNIRACLALLTYAEDCVQLERSVLTESNAAMLALFKTLTDGSAAWLSSGHLADVRIAVQSSVSRGGGRTADLLADHERYKALLSELVRCSAAARTTSPGVDAVFRAELHRCLAVLAAKDAALTQRSRGMLPL